MNRKSYLFLTIILLAALCLCGCTNKYPHRQMRVICVPVYGQSYALGEEAVRVTDFDSLRQQYGHRIVTERLDEDFGYFSDTYLKQMVKRWIGDDKRAFELQCYGMAEAFLQQNLNDSLLFCTFPNGQGATSITGMMPGSKAYLKCLDELAIACQKAKAKHWRFEVPAYCWMQGENDIVWLTSKNYKRDLEAFHRQFGKDVQRITGQKNPPVCICYQSNCLSLAKHPVNDSLFNRPELYVPNAQSELIRRRNDFVASGPSYPYACVDERIHIDGTGQKRLGYLAGISLSQWMQGKNSDGLQPKRAIIKGCKILLTFDVPVPPLVIDTTEVANPGHYGFSVVTPQNKNILQHVTLRQDTVWLSCSEAPTQCKVRYAVNGIKDKNGNRSGARGNLRDSQGKQYKATIKGKSYPLDNWCYQFEFSLFNKQ